jgi:hypothetical protein
LFTGHRTGPTRNEQVFIYFRAAGPDLSFNFRHVNPTDFAV